jgi:F0F1-type ATP synthase membrane subunit b/b'
VRNAARSGGDPDALERLRGDEAALETELAAARADAAAIVESGHREAEGIAASARREIERLRDALRAEEAAALAAEAARARAALAAELGALAGRAARSRSRALERVVAVVLGRPT